ncbi:MAG TPA: hypothetical protein VLI69_05740 [Gammaproteobacteria bacterium]|nr:hypothetical protein [Gammaproteobacteria bacterium]
MSYSKIEKPLIEGKFSRQYSEIMRQVQIAKANLTPFDLRQPSALEEVDSITTYQVSCTSFLERK